MKHIKRVYIFEAQDYTTIESRINKTCRECYVIDVQIMREAAFKWIGIVTEGYKNNVDV